MRVRILDARVEFVHRPFLRPLQISSGAITEITEAAVEVVVKVNGKESAGRGCIYLSDLWAWPDPAIPHAERDAALKDFCVWIAINLKCLCGDDDHHPLELGMRLHGSTCYEDNSPTVPPILARAMCASPFDAAIHDASGNALGISAFDFYLEPAIFPSIDHWFIGKNAATAIRKLISLQDLKLPAWLVVSKSDSIEEDVVPWIKRCGFCCFKVKILGVDNAEDVARTIEVYRSVKDVCVRKPRISVDSNEANPNSDFVLDFLQQLRSADIEVYDALEYLEQPTGRDIVKYSNDWSKVTRLKPVMLDEGLTSMDILETAVDQGWSGLALKTCKGHSFALAAAAWAQQHGLLLSMQDLTNPGYAAIHAALFAANVPTINGVELNSLQYTPSANENFLPQLAPLFNPTDGFHRLPDHRPLGLGAQAGR